MEIFRISIEFQRRVRREHRREASVQNTLRQQHHFCVLQRLTAEMAGTDNLCHSDYTDTCRAQDAKGIYDSLRHSDSAARNIFHMESPAQRQHQPVLPYHIRRRSGFLFIGCPAAAEHIYNHAGILHLHDPRGHAGEDTERQDLQEEGADILLFSHHSRHPVHINIYPPDA